MSDSPQREWKFYVKDMIGFAERVIRYTRAFQRESFSSNSLVYDKTLRNLELIGEAATKIPEFVKTVHSHIASRQIIATRNRLIHGYLGIDDDTIWSIVVGDLPILIHQLSTLHQETEDGQR